VPELGAQEYVPLATSQATNKSEWRQWRGPLATGEAPLADPPLHWNESQHVRWKTRLPGAGHSTPIVTGDLIFVTAAEPTGPKHPPKYSGAAGAHDNLPVTREHRFLLIAVHRTSGKIAWQTTLAQRMPHEGAHYTASLASQSPITDGEHVFAFFGSFGLYCVDLNGQVRWEKQLGKMHTKHGHGEGSSPVLFENTLVVNWDHEDQSFVVAIDKRDGKEIWRKEREEVTSWASPTVVGHEGQKQLVVAGTGRVRAYDLKNGKVIWECGGLSANVVATPVAGDGMVFVGSSYDTKAMMGIRLKGASGDITDSDQVVWSRTHRTPYVPSPLLYKGTLYFLRHYQGILSQVNAEDGTESIGPIRLSEIKNVYASPVAARDRIYVTDLSGVTVVISHGIPRVLSVNRIDEPVAASLALAGNELFVRGKNSLYCVSNREY